MFTALMSCRKFRAHRERAWDPVGEGGNMRVYRALMLVTCLSVALAGTAIAGNKA